MALPFNPFEKGNSKTESPKKFTKVKVFERADFEISETQPEPANASDVSVLNASDVLTSSDARVVDAEALGGGKSSDLFRPPQKPIMSQSGDINSEQTKNKLSTQPRTELRTNAEQTKNSAISRTGNAEQTKNKLSTQPRTELRTNAEQNENNIRTNSSFSQLVGLQRKIVEVVYDFCRSFGEKNTDRLSLEFLAHACNAAPAVVQVTTRRLMTKGVLLKFDSKGGRGGWTRYTLPEAVYKDLFQLEIQNKFRTNSEQTENKVSTQPRTQPRTTPPSSSRGLNLNNSTTTQPVDNFSRISEIDVTAVQAHGISHSVLSRCVELYPVLKPEHLEALVSRFAEFMKAPKSKVQNARGFFISLAEQASKGQVPLDHIETPDDRLMREFVELAKEAKARREVLEKEAFEFGFEEWVENLNARSRDELVPTSSVIESGSKIQTMKLKEHFRLNVWPTRFAVSQQAHESEA